MAAVLKNPEVLHCIDVQDSAFVETLLRLGVQRLHGLGPGLAGD